MPGRRTRGAVRLRIPGGSNRPRRSESEVADLDALLAEVLAILPVVEFRIFRAQGARRTPSTDGVPSKRSEFDTIIVPDCTGAAGGFSAGEASHLADIQKGPKAHEVFFFSQQPVGL